MRQSQGAAAICAYVKRVFESAARAKSRYGAPGSGDGSRRMMELEDEKPKQEIPEMYNMITNDNYDLVSGWKKTSNLF